MKNSSNKEKVVKKSTPLTNLEKGEKNNKVNISIEKIENGFLIIKEIFSDNQYKNLKYYSKENPLNENLKDVKGIIGKDWVRISTF